MSRSESPLIIDILEEAEHFVQSKERPISPFPNSPHLIMETTSPGATPSHISASLEGSPVRDHQVFATIEEVKEPSFPKTQEIEGSSSTTTTTATTMTTTKAVSKSKKKPSLTKRKSWKKPADRPKRPLSAYNLFFQFARERLINGDLSWEVTMEEVNKIGMDAAAAAATNNNNSNNNAPKKKRPHRKTHGKIGFKDLARTIANKWKQMDPHDRALFEKRAIVEKKKYVCQMEKWTEQQARKEAEQKKEARRIATRGIPFSDTSNSAFTDSSSTFRGTPPPAAAAGMLSGNQQLGQMQSRDMSVELEDPSTLDRRRLEDELRQLRMENMHAMMSFGHGGTYGPPQVPNTGYAMMSAPCNAAVPTMTMGQNGMQSIHHAMTPMMGGHMQQIGAPTGIMQASVPSMNNSTSSSSHAPTMMPQSTQMSNLVGPSMSHMVNCNQGSIMSTRLYPEQSYGTPAAGDYFEMANQVYNMAQVTLPPGYVPSGNPVGLDRMSANMMQQQMPQQQQQQQALCSDGLLETVMFPTPVKLRPQQTMTTTTAAAPSGLNSFVPVSQAEDPLLAMDLHHGLSSPTCGPQTNSDDDLEGIRSILDSFD